MIPIDNVDVYYNLHKRLWSCRSRRTGRVVQHAKVIVATHGAGLVVRESGRLRVVREGRKNVHAFARIDYAHATDDVRGWRECVEGMRTATLISYNPYKAGHFYRKDNGSPLTMVDSLIMLAQEGMPPVVWAVP